jgi:ribosome recycling factor
MAKAIERTHEECNSLHTGKASVGMVDCLRAETDGSQRRIKDIAAVTTPDSRTIRIQPWSKESLRPIEKALAPANVDLDPAIGRLVIRCNVPEMSRERRQQFSKVANAMAEEGRVSVHDIRRDTLNLLKQPRKPAKSPKTS